MERVIEFYKEGYNCVEFVLKVFNEDLGLDILVLIVSFFGFGMMVGSICGVIIGILMVVGVLKGRNISEEKNNLRILIKEIIIKVKEKYGIFECIELKKKGVICIEIIEYVYGFLKEYIK